MTHDEDLNLTTTYLNAFLEEAVHRRKPVVKQQSMEALARNLALDDLIQDGGLKGGRLATFLAVYLDNAFRVQHPGNMGHQVSCPHPSGALGGLIDSVTNNPMAIYEKGPAAATIEYTLVNWMLKKADWRPMPYPGSGLPLESAGGGVLTHGGSLAQLTALAAARRQADPNSWENGNSSSLVVVAPPESHYSVARALGILGLGQRAFVAAPCNGFGQMDPERLGETLAALRARGKRVMAVVANACSTAAGLYDDLSRIGDVCQSRGIWLHVDGAHGASALLSDNHRHRLAGLEKASSLIWDAHKMLRTPGLCAAVLFRDSRYLDQAFSQQASYLFHDKEQAGFDAISRTIECTKAGIGLKFFMVLAAEGEAGLADYIDGRYALAREAAKLIKRDPRFELAVEPQANIVCFRLVGLSDAQQLELRKKLLAAGESYISTTEFAGNRWMRFTFMNPRTTLKDVVHVLEFLEREASRFAGRAAA